MTMRTLEEVTMVNKKLDQLFVLVDVRLLQLIKEFRKMNEKLESESL